MEDLNTQISALGIDAFLGVTLAVERDHEFAWYVQEDEEHMVDITELIEEADSGSALEGTLMDWNTKGVSDVIIIRGW